MCSSGSVHFYQANIEDILVELKTGRQGITSDEALKRLALYGPNALAERKKKTALVMFLGQFKDFMILVLIAAAAISGIIGEASDMIAIVVIVLLNAALGLSQEYRAEKAMEALKKMAASNAVVLRDGETHTIIASKLVRGDIVLLESGRIVPADMRVIDSARLMVAEAALTGESVPTEKITESLAGESVPLGDRKNMLYKGTFVTYGRGIGVVTATGMQTELGKIATMIQEEGEVKTPLQRRLAGFGKKLAIAALAICTIIFIAGLLRGEDPIQIFLVAVSLAVAAIPEALPAVVTIALAIGARKMVKQNALVRKLPAVETLGSVSYICTDKTGTLTENRMTVERIWVDGEQKGMQGVEGMSRETIEDSRPAPHSPYSLFLTALAISNDARLDVSGNVIGDPTEAALLVAARENGFQKQEMEAFYPRLAEIPFDADRKLMTTFHTWEAESGGVEGMTGKYISFTKGAVEVMLGRATSVLLTDGVRDIDARDILEVSDRMAAEGLRVMAVGMRTWDDVPTDIFLKDAETRLIILGIMGMMDPPRKEAKESVILCKSAGITPVMITGDHPLTARAIAKRVGILQKDDPSAVITGPELDALSLEEFDKRVESIYVYARVAPEQKLKIVQALQNKGHFVAMTGDGVNDAPALKRANIGVAMGITGTDIAKEASSMILLDDNFTTIVKAVREGRRIYDNIRKFIRYLLSTNSGEIWTLFLAPFVGLPMPLQPVHILWINLLTDGLPALALSMEPEEGDIMRLPPRHPQESLFAHGLGGHAIWVGLLMAAVTLSLQAWAIRIEDTHWQSMVFTLLCFLQLGHVMAIRSERASLFSQGLFTNKPLLMSVCSTILLQLCTIYVPALNPVFRTQPLSACELLVVIALSSIIFLAVETEKFMKRIEKTA
jgi:Ca2+-transporting ATPase